MNGSPMSHAGDLFMTGLMVVALVFGAGMQVLLPETARSSDGTTPHASSGRAAAVKESEAFDLDRNVGWIHGACLGIKHTDLQPGSKVQIISLENPQKALAATVTGVAAADSNCPAMLPDRIQVNQSKGRTFYVLDVDKGANLLAVGLVGLDASLTAVKNAIQVDLQPMKTTAIAGSCQTSEGIRFYLTRPNGKTQTRIWSDYYYLGYDTKPTCRE